MENGVCKKVVAAMSLWRLAMRHYNDWIGLAEISEQPYRTHVPVLLQLAQSLRPRRIAEFGMGHFSTSIFLDRMLFPSVEQLSSFEDDPEWFSTIEHKHSRDARFDAHLVLTPMWKAAMRLRALDYDLVLVDDSKRAGDRVRTLLALRLAKGVTKGPVVVVHDVDQPRYRAATLLFPNRAYYNELSPQTGVLCRKRCTNNQESS
jgi:predicted O-methyltransferase YrrM